MTTKTEFIVCGRVVGFASGWDKIDDEAILLYDLESAPNLHLGEGDVEFNFETGIVTKYSKTGEKVYQKDIVEVLRQVPRKEEMPG